MNRYLLIAALAVLSIITVMAVWQEGLAAVVPAVTGSWWSLQIFFDLVIALVLFMVWMYHDAKKLGRNPWPWIVATFVVGSFSPLFYLLTRKDTAQR